MDAPVQPGQILGGKFRVERVIGVGGMGVVVAATHLQLEERVALKFLLPAALQQPDVVQRFAREARHAVRIKSEHVARVSDVGVLENGAPYMVMEYLEGADLAAVLARRGPLPIPDAIEHVIQACEALAEAHSMGIIHRDLKPANLFLTTRKDGSKSIKVLDFGISKTALTGSATPDMSLTATSAVMGSPLYMSPEQMRSARDVDNRTDIWSLGVTLHELLTGKAAFGGDTITQLCSAVLTEMPAPLRALRPDAPVELQVVLLKTLEKQAVNRYANVGELAVALAPFAPPRALPTVERIATMTRASGAHVAFEVQQPSVARKPGADMSTTTAWSDEETRVLPKRRSPAVVVVIALAGVVILGGLGLLARHALAPTPVKDEPVASKEPPPPTSTSAQPAHTVAPVVAPVATPVLEIPPITASATPTVAHPGPLPMGSGKLPGKMPGKTSGTGTDIGF